MDEELNWVVSLVIELVDVDSVVCLYECLCEVLVLLLWYGCNWDVFWDVISGLVLMFW